MYRNEYVICSEKVIWTIWTGLDATCIAQILRGKRVFCGVYLHVMEKVDWTPCLIQYLMTFANFMMIYMQEFCVDSLEFSAELSLLDSHSGQTGCLAPGVILLALDGLGLGLLLLILCFLLPTGGHGLDLSGMLACRQDTVSISRVLSYMMSICSNLCCTTFFLAKEVIWENQNPALRPHCRCT